MTTVDDVRARGVREPAVRLLVVGEVAVAVLDGAVGPAGRAVGERGVQEVALDRFPRGIAGAVDARCCEQRCRSRGRDRRGNRRRGGPGNGGADGPSLALDLDLHFRLLADQRRDALGGQGLGAPGLALASELVGGPADDQFGLRGLLAGERDVDTQAVADDRGSRPGGSGPGQTGQGHDCCDGYQDHLAHSGTVHPASAR